MNRNIKKIQLLVTKLHTSVNKTLLNLDISCFHAGESYMVVVLQIRQINTLMVGSDEQNLQWKRGKGGVCLLLLHMLVNNICHFCFGLE